MKKIPTAKKYLQGSETYDKDYPTISLYDAEQRMIEFAKLHVEQALKAAYENIEYTEVDSSVPYVVEDSILNSYPLSNIK